MASKHPGLPSAASLILTKSSLLKALAIVDADKAARARVLTMETDFRRRVGVHVESLPLQDAAFGKFKTNPFVLLFHSFHKRYTRISDIEQDILPAKLFSSMETSAGKMVETVVLPIYGWDPAPSGMHTAESLIDARRLDGEVLRLATLKSGPRCLNDPTSENIADNIIAHCPAWANSFGVKKLDFTYGVLYGTKKMSNKKDWHILRNIADKLPKRAVTVKPTGRWDCEFTKDGVSVSVTIRVGTELWGYFAHQGHAFIEMIVALIRACIIPGDTESADHPFTISDLRAIISLEPVPVEYNVSLLQRGQLEWLFFIARHFCDELRDA